ncbi:hypothetical protein BD626DRAFT_440969, partial [Schizophyllum amplum]
MDELIKNELADSTPVDVEGLNEILFPDVAFPITLQEIFTKMCEISPELYDHKSRKWQDSPNFRDSDQELPIAVFFEKICNLVRAVYAALGKKLPEEHRSWSADHRSRPLDEGVLARQPDIVGILIELRTTWACLRVDVQHKGTINAKDLVTTQLNDGGMNSLSSQDDRLFHVGIGMTGSLIFTTYFDRAGRLRSTSTDIHQEPLAFLRILLGLTFLDKRHLGYDSTILTSDEHPGVRFVIVAGRTYEILERLNKRPEIRGLGTVCWRCKTKIEDGKDLIVVIKNSWADRSREHTEDVYLKRAAEKHIQGVPTCIAYEVVMIDGRRISTSDIRSRLKQSAQFKNVEVRDLSRLVMNELCVPLENFATKSELLLALVDAVTAHKKLCEDADILHTDICDKNVMLTVADKSSRQLSRKGMLIDLNYARFMPYTRIESSKGQRSCPAFFKACELLSFPQLYEPAYYHDLESFTYVLMWICVCYNGPKGKRRENFSIMESEFGLWLDSHPRRAGGTKKDIMALRAADEPDPFVDFLKATFSPYFQDFMPCVYALRQAVMRSGPTRCTHDEFLGIL